MDEYLTVPSHPTHLADGSFTDFCDWAATSRGLTLPSGIDYAHWLQYGEKRLLEVRQQELLRHLFRRPLELWMVYDYACFLEENGYSVEVTEFCPRQLTPRNVLIDAQRTAPQARLQQPGQTGAHLFAGVIGNDLAVGENNALERPLQQP